MKTRFTTLLTLALTATLLTISSLSAQSKMKAGNLGDRKKQIKSGQISYGVEALSPDITSRASWIKSVTMPTSPANNVQTIVLKDNCYVMWLDRVQARGTNPEHQKKEYKIWVKLDSRYGDKDVEKVELVGRRTVRITWSPLAFPVAGTLSRDENGNFSVSENLTLWKETTNHGTTWLYVKAKEGTLYASWTNAYRGKSFKNANSTATTLLLHHNISEIDINHVEGQNGNTLKLLID